MFAWKPNTTTSMWNSTQGGEDVDMNPNTNRDLVRMRNEIINMKYEIDSIQRSLERHKNVIHRTMTFSVLGIVIAALAVLAVGTYMLR